MSKKVVENLIKFQGRVLTLATGKSLLAIRSAGQVRLRLGRLIRGVDFKLEPFAGGPDNKIKVLMDTVLSQEMDGAIISAKDLPAELPQELCVAAVIKRQNPRDVLLVSLPPVSSSIKLSELPFKATVQFTALTSWCQIKQYRSDLKHPALSGGLPALIEQVRSGQCDGLIMSGEDVEILKASDLVGDHIAMDISLTPPGQGATIIIARCSDNDILELFENADDEKSRLCIEAEWSIRNALTSEGWIVAAWVRAQTRKVLLDAAVMPQDGSIVYRESISGPIEETQALTSELCNLLLERKNQ